MIRFERFSASLLSASWYLVLAVLVPLASLALVGLWALWQSEFLFPAVCGWLLVTAIAWFFLIHLPRRKLAREIEKTSGSLSAETGGKTEVSLPHQLDAQRDWSEHDHVIWQHALTEIDTLLEENPPWEALPTLAVAVLERVSVDYHGKSSQARYRFTLPEALLVASETSERYRRLLIDHLPFVESLRLGTLIGIAERQGDIRSGIRWVNNTRRMIRLANPMNALLAEMRDQLTNQFLGQLGNSIQSDLKRLLLQETAQVGIDLYSGRLKRSRHEMASYRSRAEREDDNRPAQPQEPLRVLVVGQTSAGKSSLVNALLGCLAAETDILPSTDSATVHLLADDTRGMPIKLIDTPGLDGSEARLAEIVALALESDLLLHVARATTSARAADRDFHEALDAAWAERPERRRTPESLALTHIDKLPPRGQWSPPYDLDDSSNRKAATIARALASARDVIGLDPEAAAIPVCLDAAAGHYNVDALSAYLLAQLDEAQLAQLNRRRLEAGRERGSWRERWNRLSRLGRVSGRFVTNSLLESLQQVDRKDRS
ncbi:MAG: hypothetical protein CSB44_11330 [Gammaproteobacteria bacterium]|nr:MAG: hypothetical protein CSB44_11330 [Gammaproteobacteria bacterium]